MEISITPKDSNLKCQKKKGCKLLFKITAKRGGKKVSSIDAYQLDGLSFIMTMILALDII